MINFMTCMVGLESNYDLLPARFAKVSVQNLATVGLCIIKDLKIFPPRHLDQVLFDQKIGTDD